MANALTDDPGPIVSGAAATPPPTKTTTKAPSNPRPRNSASKSKAKTSPPTEPGANHDPEPVADPDPAPEVQHVDEPETTGASAADVADNTNGAEAASETAAAYAPVQQTLDIDDNADAEADDTNGGEPSLYIPAVPKGFALVNADREPAPPAAPALPAAAHTEELERATAPSGPDAVADAAARAHTGPQSAGRLAHFKRRPSAPTLARQQNSRGPAIAAIGFALLGVGVTTGPAALSAIDAIADRGPEAAAQADTPRVDERTKQRKAVKARAADKKARQRATARVPTRTRVVYVTRSTPRRPATPTRVAPAPRAPAAPAPVASAPVAAPQAPAARAPAQSGLFSSEFAP